jgi:hypothetical protein
LLRVVTFCTGAWIKNHNVCPTECQSGPRPTDIKRGLR